MVYVTKCIFSHDHLKPVLTKIWHSHFTVGYETLIPTTKSSNYIYSYIPQPITQKPSQMFHCIK